MLDFGELGKIARSAGGVLQGREKLQIAAVAAARISLRSIRL
jgi:hypothetical protein